MTTTIVRPADSLGPDGQGRATEQPSPSPTQGGTPTRSADPRVKALRRFAASITVLTVVGHAFLGFEQSPATPVLAALTAYGLELLLEAVDAWARRRPVRYIGGPGALVTFLLPAHIAAMACAMLLYAGPVVWPYLCAVAVAVSAKYLVKAPTAKGWRHTMNPSNSGIVFVLLVFPWVGIAPPYQFTEHVGQPVDWLLPLGVLMAGTMLNARLTHKGPLILAWVGGFIAQALVRSVMDGTTLVPSLLPLTGVAFVLFTNYMITDPGTTPMSRRGQCAFGLTCAAWYGVLVHEHVVFGLFFALVGTCALRTLGLHLLALERRLLVVTRLRSQLAGRSEPTRAVG